MIIALQHLSCLSTAEPYLGDGPLSAACIQNINMNHDCTAAAAAQLIAQLRHL